MPVRAKDIKGFMIEKKEYYKDGLSIIRNWEDENGKHHAHICSVDGGRGNFAEDNAVLIIKSLNQTIDQMSNRSLGLNRENLIKIIMSNNVANLIREIVKSEGTYLFSYDHNCQQLVDAIISQEHNLLESREGK